MKQGLAAYFGVLLFFLAFAVFLVYNRPQSKVPCVEMVPQWCVDKVVGG